MQGDDAVALLQGDEFLHIVAWFGVGDVVPFVSVAGLYRPFVVNRPCDGEMKRDDAVASLYRSELLFIVTAFRVGDAIPCV